MDQPSERLSCRATEIAGRRLIYHAVEIMRLSRLLSKDRQAFGSQLAIEQAIGELSDHQIIKLLSRCASKPSGY